MAEFEIEGRKYNTENFSDHQKKLLSSLSTTENLISEIKFKNDEFLKEKKKQERIWKSEFGSKVNDISEKDAEIKITLANGKNLNLSSLNEDSVLRIKNLSFLNQQISYYGNQLQVLDTAKITYSKEFYQTLNGAE